MSTRPIYVQIGTNKNYLEQISYLPKIPKLYSGKYFDLIFFLHFYANNVPKCCKYFLNKRKIKKMYSQKRFNTIANSSSRTYIVFPAVTEGRRPNNNVSYHIKCISYYV